MQSKFIQKERTSLNFQLVHHEQMLKNARKQNADFGETMKIYGKIKVLNARLAKIDQLKVQPENSL